MAIPLSKLDDILKAKSILDRLKEKRDKYLKLFEVSLYFNGHSAEHIKNEEELFAIKQLLIDRIDKVIYEAEETLKTLGVDTNA